MTRLFAEGLAGAALPAVVLSIGITAGLRRISLGPIGGWAVSTLLMFWFISARFFTDTLWGPFPSGGTLQAIGEAIRAGADQTANEIAPVEPTTPLLMFVTAGIWFTAWLVDTALTRLRNPVLAVASAVPLFVVPGAIVPSSRLAVEVVLFLLGGSLVLFHDQAERFHRLGPQGADDAVRWRIGPAARIVLVAGIVVAAIAPALPGFGRPPVFAGTGGVGSQVYFNPIVAIKPALDRDIDVELFQVRASELTYYRLTALEVFDGRVWQAEEERATRRFDASVVERAGPTEHVRQEFEISALAGPWLPAAYQPVSVTGELVNAEIATKTLLTSRRLEVGMSYTVESAVPAPTAEELDQPITYDPQALGRLVSLPSSVPARVGEIAREVTRGATTPYQQALAIQRHLRTFRYDENVAAGHSFNDMVTFLTEVRAGYCEQFAGTMAVMARTLGIPARVAIGFGLGEQLDIGHYSITTRQAHAWVEVWFPQAGWVAFEPTPRSGVTALPDYAPAPRANRPDDAGNSPEPRETTEPEPTESAEPLPSAPPGAGGSDGPGNDRGWMTGVAILALALAGVAAGPVVALVRRRRRIAVARDARALVGAHYADFLEWCAAAGLGRHRAETPREHAARLAVRVAEARTDLDVLTGEVEAALYAPPNGLDAARAAGAAVAVRAAVTPTLTRADRVRAALRWGNLRPRG